MDDSAANALRWLQKQGYPLELRVGDILRKRGWRVEHARWYRDPGSGKHRELDILATRSYSSKEPDATFAVSLAIECKTSQKGPWIVFVAPRDLPDDLADFETNDILVADTLSRAVFFTAAMNKIELPHPSLYRPSSAMVPSELTVMAPAATPQPRTPV